MMRVLFFIFSVWAPCGNTDEATDLRVLFLSNSYTYYQDLPKVLVNLAASSSGVKITAQFEAPPGATLKGHLKNKKTLDLIDMKSWDMVVLQEQSRRPVVDPEKMYVAARVLDKRIKDKGARTVFFMTWARANDPCMLKGLAESYEHIADELGAIVVPVGKAWALARKDPNSPSLYDPDGSHPNAHGTYLAACTFYAVLTGRDPRGLSNGGLKQVNAAQAKHLQEIAWQATR